MQTTTYDNGGGGTEQPDNDPVSPSERFQNVQEDFESIAQFQTFAMQAHPGETMEDGTLHFGSDLRQYDLTQDGELDVFDGIEASNMARGGAPDPSTEPSPRPESSQDSSGQSPSLDLGGEVRSALLAAAATAALGWVISR